MDTNKHISALNLEDIARLSGVSRSTVSRVINQHPNVSEVTRQRVMEVVAQYNYQPHPAARALASLRSQVIGILIPHNVSDIFTDPFFPILLQGISASAHSLDYTSVLWLTDHRANETDFYDRVFSNRLVDGIIVASANVDEAFLNRLDKTEKHYVFVGRPAVGYERVNFVDVENQHGGRLVAEHLIARGRTRIGMIVARPSLTASQDRQQGYISALQAAGMAINLQHIVTTPDYSERSGYDGAKVLLNREVDAIFAANDLIALGAIRAIHEAGLSVPEDIAVVGYDDVPAAAIAQPPLTTIRQPIGSLGELSTRALLGLIEGQLAPPIRQVLPVDLVVRAST